MISSRRGELSVLGRGVGAGVEGAAAAADPAQRAVRRDPGTAALRRPDRPRGRPRHGPDPGRDHPGIRETLHRDDYVEIETPVLQLVHGGANARPFHTHLNAFDTT